MARRRRLDVRPSDPRKAEEYDRAQAQLQATEADQKAAKVRGEADAERRSKAFSEGVKSTEQRLADEQAALLKQKKDVEKAHADYLKTPLSPQEAAELDALESAAMSGKSIPPDQMRRLSDLRIRSKVTKD